MRLTGRSWRPIPKRDSVKERASRSPAGPQHRGLNQTHGRKADPLGVRYGGKADICRLPQRSQTCGKTIKGAMIIGHEFRRQAKLCI